MTPMQSQLLYSFHTKIFFQTSSIISNIFIMILLKFSITLKDEDLCPTTKKCT